MTSPLTLLLLSFSRGAFAYETDQLTYRSEDLEDALPAANARMDALLAEAIAATNQRTRCEAPREEARAVLAQEIDRHAAGARLVWGRPPARMLGYGRYQAWLETAPLDRHTFYADDSGMFAELEVWDNPVLTFAGTCSTIRLGEAWIGTDKLDHFLGEGYTYFEIAQKHAQRSARRGEPDSGPEEAWAWGTWTEFTTFGMEATGVFSFADLRANYDGWRFYTGLLGDGSVATVDAGGCVQQARPWDWSEWVTWEYDELFNPSLYDPAIQEKLNLWLDEHREEVCVGYDQWGPLYEDRVAQTLGSRPPYLPSWAPERVDPFLLRLRCTGAEVPVTLPERLEKPERRLIRQTAL